MSGLVGPQSKLRFRGLRRGEVIHQSKEAHAVRSALRRARGIAVGAAAFNQSERELRDHSFCTRLSRRQRCD
jgi:hypothetical protein